MFSRQISAASSVPSITIPHRRANRPGRSQPIEGAGQPKLPGEGALDLAARRLRQRAGPQQGDLVWHDVVLRDDRLADTADQLLGHDPVTLGALDLLHDDQLLAFRVIGDREGGAAVTAQGGVAALRRVLDILRVMVGAAYDDDVLDAAGDEQLARVVEKAEIAGAQPEAIPFSSDTGAERRCGRLGVLPVALRDIGSRGPDLAD